MIQQQLAETAAFIKNRYGKPIAGCVILGSGLGEYANQLQNAVSIPYSEIPHFSTSHVVGHAGRLVIGEVRPGFAVACMQGRFHYYEGNEMYKVVYPVRAFREMGATFLIVTNAAGGVNPDFKPGTLMLITDHINLMGANPLIGPNHEELGPRFPDMSEAYSTRLRNLAKEVAKNQGTELAEGVYVANCGPMYETPAEVRMIRTLGGDAVGMSTVPEVIAANHLGLEVLGISCITNAAAGITNQKLSHDEVIDTTERVKSQFVNLISGVLNQLASADNLAKTRS